MERDDELLIACIGLNYVIKDLEEELNGAEMCRMSDINETINRLTEVKKKYMLELANQAVERYGI